jgi:hypothetical protein
MNDEMTEEEKVEEKELAESVGADGIPLVQLLDSLHDVVDWVQDDEVVDKTWRAASVGLIVPSDAPVVDGIGPNGTPIGFVPLSIPSCPAANAVA